MSQRTGTRSHFDLGCALLNEEGRSAVRQFCAKELFFLQSKHASLYLEGHTDTIDCKKRNVELSQLRVLNVERAMRDTLGRKMALVYINRMAHGELFAGHPDFGGLPDETADRAWRRVEICLSGRTSLRLQA